MRLHKRLIKRGTNSLATQVVAVVAVITVLTIAGVSVAVIFMLTGVAFIVWRVAMRSRLRKTSQVFSFYIEADEVLRSDEKHWYGFEVVELINHGEQILASMPDPPPLCHFAVGALCFRIGQHDRAVARLSRVIEDSWVEERRLAVPSLQLRRYVEMLRAIEREPATAPQALGALRSLERMRQRFAAQWLVESRKLLAIDSLRSKQLKTISPSDNHSMNSHVPPPPISELLHQLYDE